MNVSIERKIGDNIRKLREKIGFTQEYVATKLQLEGCDITRSALAKIEVGQRHLYPDEIIFLKKILRTNYEEIFSLNWLIAKAARVNRAANFLDRHNRGRNKKNRAVRKLTAQKDEKWRCPILPVSDPTSTFGVRKLNFCVRYGNRWNLSAIITTMVIYQTIMVKHIQIMFLNTMYPFSEVILSLTLCLIYSASPPFKNFFLSISFPEDWQLHSKQFLVQTQNLLVFIL